MQFLVQPVFRICPERRTSGYYPLSRCIFDKEVNYIFRNTECCAVITLRRNHIILVAFIANSVRINNCFNRKRFRASDNIVKDFIRTFARHVCITFQSAAVASLCQLCSSVYGKSQPTSALILYICNSFQFLCQCQCFPHLLAARFCHLRPGGFRKSFAHCRDILKFRNLIRTNSVSSNSINPLD